MPAETTQPSLLSRVRDPDDQTSWRQFDVKYRDLILRYARGRGLQPADAEDVRQLVMMGLARSLRSFQYQPDVGRFRDYLGRIVHNAVSRHLSCPNGRRARLSTDDLDVVDPKADLASDDAWDREWMHHHFRMAMQKARRSFEPKSLEIFEHLLAGRNPSELANTFSVSQDLVYKVRQRVRDFLQMRIAEQIREEEFPERL